MRIGLMGRGRGKLSRGIGMGLALAVCAGLVTLAGQTAEQRLRDRARAIHDAVLTIDSHDDIPFDFATDAVDPLNARRQVTLERMRTGGLDVGFFIVYVGQPERTPMSADRAHAAALTKFEAIHRMAERYPDRIGIASTADDVERLHASGRLVAAIGIENGHVVGSDLSRLERYHELGARYITLAHNGHNDLADSAQPRPDLGDDGPEHGGISDLGARVIAEMNRLGIMVDISHISKAAALEAIRLSRAPVIASHSNARAVTDHPRNLDDETLRALRDRGGVMQTTAVADFLRTRTPAQREAMAALLESRGARFSEWPLLAAEQTAVRARLETLGLATVGDLVDHIDHAVDLIGVDHVGLSSDFDGGGGVLGWLHAGETFNVTLELVRRGYTEEEVAKLWGGNLLRVWREAERVAATSE